MTNSGGLRLTGWQRANVVAAAEYMRELMERAPGNARARAVCEGLLDVLEPPRRAARAYGEDRRGTAGSMWDRRCGRDRRGRERRAIDATLAAGEERRRVQRRSGRERRAERA